MLHSNRIFWRWGAGATSTTVGGGTLWGGGGEVALWRGALNGATLLTHHYEIYHSVFALSEPAVTIITALNLGGVGIGPWHFLFVGENFRSRLRLNVCTLVQRCRKASEQRILRRLTGVVHVIRLEHRMPQHHSLPGCWMPACCLDSGCCTIPTVCEARTSDIMRRPPLKWRNELSL